MSHVRNLLRQSYIFFEKTPKLIIEFSHPITVFVVWRRTASIGVLRWLLVPATFFLSLAFPQVLFPSASPSPRRPYPQLFNNGASSGSLLSLLQEQAVPKVPVLPWCPGSEDPHLRPWQEEGRRRRVSVRCSFSFR